jgi:Uma2 family endonuclease
MIETAPSQAQKTWTEAELEALPDDGYIHEVVNGELIMSPKNNFRHENICGRLYFAMESFNREHRLGVVLGSSAGCWMKNRNCRAPDVSFIPNSRLIQLGFRRSTRKFFPGAPNLAAEVLSPSNTRAEMDERLKDFFASGTQLAWIIDPDNESVEVCHSPTERQLIGSGGFLEGQHLLPGFRYLIADLFQDRGWQ